jgi:hypothetical protein
VGNCRAKEPFAEVMDPEESYCIQRNDTLEVKTLGLIVDSRFDCCNCHSSNLYF